MRIEDLVAQAGLPAVRSTRPLTDGPGLDNRLTLLDLEDGRRVLARQPHGAELHDQTPRARFLEHHRVGAPKLYAAGADGSTLVEWIVGTSLAEHVAAADDHATDPVWRQLGAALAAVHAVTFPSLLQGEFGPTGLNLRPIDPVTGLHESLRRSREWARQDQSRLVAVHDRLAELVDHHAEEIRAEQPCLLHGDVTFDNFIVTEHAVRPIDWDFPRVGSPLSELGALDEHAYLNGISTGLPVEFWQGYGRSEPRSLLLLHRAIGCLGWLASPEWSTWEADESLSEQARRRLRDWNHRLHAWSDTLPERLGPGAT